MKIVCSWCGKDIGEKPPLKDKNVTHALCNECLAEHFPDVAEKMRIYGELENGQTFLLTPEWVERYEEDERATFEDATFSLGYVDK